MYKFGEKEKKKEHKFKARPGTDEKLISVRA
jgi:hypothetical protein